MVRGTVRLRRAGGSGANVWRGWLAFLLFLAVVAASGFVFTRDLDWEVRGRAMRRLGVAAVNGGDYRQARRYFDAALNDNPYDWRARLALANLLNQYFDEPNEALLHYLHALAYVPDPIREEDARANIDILRRMRGGELEDPRNALEDMYVAMESNAPEVFSRRLEPNLRRDAGTYWEGWKARGRGWISHCRVERAGNGRYDAAVTLEFPDGSGMLVHLACSPRDIWRLRTGFP